MRNNIVDGKTESLSQITKEDRWLTVVLIKLTQQVHCDCFDLQTKKLLELSSGSKTTVQSRRLP